MKEYKIFYISFALFYSHLNFCCRTSLKLKDDALFQFCCAEKLKLKESFEKKVVTISRCLTD